MKGSVQFEKHRECLAIEFHHPKGNGMTSDMLRKLAAGIMDASARADVKSILIRSSAPGAFCGGASLDELEQVSSLSDAKAFFLGFAGVILAIRSAPKPVIVRVHGKCVGGGTGIVAAADMAFAMQDASVRLSELSIGIGPFVIGPALERKIGVAGFSRLSLRPQEWSSADWALRHGLYTEIYESIESMDQAIDQQLKWMGTWDTDAIAANKRLLWSQTPDWDALLEERAAQVAELWMRRKRTGQPK